MQNKQSYLRESVGVSSSPEYVLIQHSVWEYQLPRTWIESLNGIQGFLSRQLSAESFVDKEKRASGLIKLLEEQGCLSYPEDRMRYSFKEIKEIFKGVCSSWYGIYYSHPLWNRLIQGTLSKNALITWLLYNYHLSKSAGISDARCATRLPRKNLRGFFQSNALEEYSHCDDYFFVEHSNLNLKAEDVYQYIQLPSSLNFDQQMYRMAEEDWLGHLLVSLFQESSIKFYQECKEFYHQVEARYKMENFFQPWIKHMELDLNLSHAGRLSDVLDSDELCKREDLINSMKNAWFTFGFLLDGLNDILAQDRNDDIIRLRLPIVSDKEDPSYTSLLDDWNIPDSNLIPSGQYNMKQLYINLEKLGITSLFLDQSFSSTFSSMSEEKFLLRDLTTSIYRCLSYATEHWEIINLGRIASIALSKLQENAPELVNEDISPNSPYTIALSNFLRERSTSTAELSFLLYHLCNLQKSDNYACIPCTEKSMQHLQTILEKTILPNASSNRLITLLIQFNEVFARWKRNSSVNLPNFFTM